MQRFKQNALEHTFTGLTPYTNYVIEVFASNGEYNRTSNFYEQRTGQYIPGPVTELVVEPGVHFLSVTWGEPSVLNGVIQQYHVIVEESEGNQIYQNNVTSDTKTVNVTENIKPYTSYMVSVQAKTEYETWGSFTRQQTRTLQTTPSAHPMYFMSEGSELTDTSITLTWAEIPREQRNGVIVHYKITISPVGTEKITSKLAETFFGLSPITDYKFSVVGCVRLLSGEEKCGPAANTSETTKGAVLACAEPGTIDNAVLQNQRPWTLGTLALYACKEGFIQTGGDRTLICSNSADKPVWKGDQLICKKGATVELVVAVTVPVGVVLLALTAVVTVVCHARFIRRSDAQTPQETRTELDLTPLNSAIPDYEDPTNMEAVPPTPNTYENTGNVDYESLQVNSTIDSNTYEKLQ